MSWRLGLGSGRGDHVLEVSFFLKLCEHLPRGLGFGLHHVTHLLLLVPRRPLLGGMLGGVGRVLHRKERIEGMVGVIQRQAVQERYESVLEFRGSGGEAGDELVVEPDELVGRDDVQEAGHLVLDLAMALTRGLGLGLGSGSGLGLG